MTDIQQYQQQARDCMALAGKTRDHTQAGQLLKIAAAWIKLAEEADSRIAGPRDYRTPRDTARTYIGSMDIKRGEITGKRLGEQPTGICSVVFNDRAMPKPSLKGSEAS